MKKYETPFIGCVLLSASDIMIASGEPENIGGWIWGDTLGGEN